jgi:hypothetical protein
MAGQTGVQVRIPSIDKEWRKLGGDDMWLHLRTTTGSLDDFAAAAAEVNATAGEGVWAEAPSHAPQGYAVLLTHCADRELLHQWIAEFAHQLESRGLTGALQGAPQVKPRAWLSSTRPTEPAAYLMYTVDLAAMTADPYRNSHWHVPAAPTVRITAAADRWARLPGAEMQLRHNIYVVAVDLDDPAEPLARSLHDTGMAGLDFVDDASRRATHVSFTPRGVGLYQDTIGDAADWQLMIERLRAALTALPADTDQGFIRPAVRWSIGIDTLDAVLPLPRIREYHVRYNRHLLDRYVPDAHGIQVLRGAHLERAHDLSGWEISDLGADRHLVQARDLAPWYAQQLPDPDVLAQARADFAGMLLTEDIIAANPPPW